MSSIASSKFIGVAVVFVLGAGLTQFYFNVGPQALLQRVREANKNQVQRATPKQPNLEECFGSPKLGTYKSELAFEVQRLFLTAP